MSMEKLCSLIGQRCSVSCSGVFGGAALRVYKLRVSISVLALIFTCDQTSGLETSAAILSVYVKVVE